MKSDHYASTLFYHATLSLPSNFGTDIKGQCYFLPLVASDGDGVLAVRGQLKTLNKPTILIQCAQISPGDFTGDSLCTDL